MSLFHTDAEILAPYPSRPEKLSTRLSLASRISSEGRIIIAGEIHGRENRNH